ncbi:SDR family oxidoreductase [Tomitella cavernea]|uniref:SDR family oxidoreductase n=1 Tax=Tomitella cavernea TaxID=1387982 RepID=A0ABP9CM24_9ACTN|nr:SDR family oxidoreductase [Tomitella cavernea]
MAVNVENSAGRRRGVAVVTGGSAGVGRATVRRFAQHGYDVAILARGRAGLDGAAADVREHGRVALPLQVDVAEETQVHGAVARVEEQLGDIDVWVNAAFTGSLAFSWDTATDLFRRITEVTYYGQVYGTLAALSVMRPRDEGVIVNVGSAMAYRSIPLQSAYCGAKHAIKGFSESVRTELLATGSRVAVRMVQLPGLNTPQFNWNASAMPGHPQPVAPVFQPELPARAIVFLAEHPRRNMWVGLSTVYTILGERFAPALVDRYLARTGVSGQQTDERLPRWGANTSVARDEEHDRGAHGPFDSTAHARDPQLWLSMHRRTIVSAAGTLAAAAGTLAATGIACKKTTALP